MSLVALLAFGYGVFIHRLKQKPLEGEEVPFALLVHLHRFTAVLNNGLQHPADAAAFAAAKAQTHLPRQVLLGQYPPRMASSISWFM